MRIDIWIAEQITRTDRKRRLSSTVTLPEMKISYIHTMISKMQTRSGIKLTEIPIDIVPNKILQIMLSHEGFKTSTIFGKEGLGDPEEYEKLVLDNDAGTRTFEFFNKGLSQMMYGTE